MSALDKFCETVGDVLADGDMVARRKANGWPDPRVSYDVTPAGLLVPALATGRADA